MGGKCCKPSKKDGHQNGPDNSQDPNHVLASVPTTPQHVAPVAVTNKRPPPAVPPKKRE